MLILVFVAILYIVTKLAQCEKQTDKIEIGGIVKRKYFGTQPHNTFQYLFPRLRQLSNTIIPHGVFDQSVSLDFLVRSTDLSVSQLAVDLLQKCQVQLQTLHAFVFQYDDVTEERLPLVRVLRHEES